MVERARSWSFNSSASNPSFFPIDLVRDRFVDQGVGMVGSPPAGAYGRYAMHGGFVIDRPNLRKTRVQSMKASTESVKLQAKRLFGRLTNRRFRFLFRRRKSH